MSIGKICMETTTLKRFYSIIIVAFFILNISMITPISQTATASDYQGVGNWVIEDNTTVTGETIVVYGNVIVKDGGSLTLDHCTLKVESIVPGSNGIGVEAGGELYVYGTTITSNGEWQYYYFDVYGKLMIDGADISKMCLYGLSVYETKDAIIKNSNVHDNGPIADGIFFLNSTGEIIGSSIYKNIRGIEILEESIVKIVGNTIHSNSQVGILSSNSKVSINNNTISDTYRGIQIGGGTVNIAKNIITSNENGGIVCVGDSRVDINNNTISDSYGDQGRGISMQDNCTASIANNIIISNKQVGIFCSDNSKANLTNNIITSSEIIGIDCMADSKVDINNNTISDTGRGIQIAQNSVVSVANNIITSNKQVGILCNENSKVDINNNIISKTEGGVRMGVGIQVADYCIASIGNNYIILNEDGIAVYDLANVKIYNSSITNSINYDIWVENGSHPTLINTQFDLNKLFFNDTKSIISIGYWVDVNVENKNNVPVQNARVAVMNNNGTEVFNGTSDYDGHCLAPVVEYDLDWTFTKKGYTPHNIYASKLGQYASEKITVDRDRVVNFTLDVSDKLAHGNLITQIVEGHDVTVEYSGNGTVTIDSTTKPAKIPNATEDIGIFVNINAVGDVEDVYITIRYSDNELEGVDEANLRMYCYFEPGDFEPGDFEPGDFELLEPGDFTGGWVKVKNSGVDTYGNVVWAKVSHLTIFAPIAEEVAKPVSRGNIWYLYGGAGVTSLAVLWIVFFITFRKRIVHKSKAGK